MNINISIDDFDDITEVESKKVYIDSLGTVERGRIDFLSKKLEDNLISVEEFNELKDLLTKFKEFKSKCNNQKSIIDTLNKIKRIKIMQKNYFL